MKNYPISPLAAGFWAMLASFLFFSCDGGPVDCGCDELACEVCADKIEILESRYSKQYLEDANGYHELIAAFHAATNPSGSAGTVKDQIDLYFDMSDGMYEKVQEAEAQGTGLLTDLINVSTSVGNKLSYFRLESGTGEKIRPIEEPNVRQYVRTVSNYNSSFNYAPLDTAVAVIVRNHDRQSIFITDGELARSDIRGAVDPGLAWAVKPFTEWLSQGNRLDFVVMPTSRDERLFFIFFTPQKLANRTNSGIEAFLEATRDVNRNEGYRHLKFTINDYRLEQQDDGRAKDQVGLNSTLVYNVGYYSPRYAVEDGYTHLHFDDIQAFAEFTEAFAAGDFNGDFDPKLDEKNKLFFNLQLTNEFINYQIANLDLKVEDFTQALGAYMDYQRCGRADTAIYIDEEGNKQTFWCNPYAGCADTTACIFPESQWRGSPIADLFTLHEESVLKEEANAFRTASIAIKPVASDKFDVNALYNMGCARLDLYIRDVNYDPKKQDFDLLRWPYEGRYNTGLSESIRLAMRDLKPQNRLIYTYYITFPAESLAL
ncbi:MAG: hypothetical protein D6722_03525 [Bacteroidetes bacterium]|nr:MAG: hypothetical protein D6722_03525 [Bacteroidota bacterium]